MEALQEGLGRIFLTVVAIPLNLIFSMRKLLRKSQYLSGNCLTSKVCLITGASSGIGESLAHSFYQKGCRLILVSRNKEELERVKNDLMRLKTTGTVYVPVVFPMDLGDLAAIPKKCEEILKIYDCVDILINNAGASQRGKALDTGLDLDVSLMNINYFGAIGLTKAIVRRMIDVKNEGSVVFVSSVQGKIAIPERSSYGATKHALQAFADSFRAEVARNNINICVVSPGYVKTNLSVNAFTGSGEKYGKMDETISNGYSPEYVADRILEAVVCQEMDVVIAPVSNKLAILIRCLIPALYFYIMKRRARR